MRITFLFVCLIIGGYVFSHPVAKFSKNKSNEKKLKSEKCFSYQYREGKLDGEGFQLSEVLYDKNGYILERFNRPLYGNAIYHQYFTYDSLGNLVTETQNDKFKTAYKYDKNKKLIEKQSLDYYSNAIKTVEFHKYDRDGNEVETVEKNSKGEQVRKRVYVYNKNEQKSIIDYDRNDSVSQTTKISTSEKSRQEITFSPTNEILSRSVHIFDNDKNEVEYSDYIFPPKMDSLCVNRYMKYDKQGNCIERVEKQNGKFSSKQTTTYDSEGRVIESVFFKENDERSSLQKIIYEYYE